MPSKLFISYRREDSAANALGISQYLEHQFGRKNVFIDVDMRAGTKFPVVLEQRLAECKVMLVLIGPEWLNARDKQGHRRLDISDDWVRLEITHALKRNITVIPVCVNGAELPPKEELPNDIRGLLDHQAVSVSTTGFRHEMSGLVRDIRSIPGARPWRRIAAMSTCAVLLLLTVLALAGYPKTLERIRLVLFPQISKATNQNNAWTRSPGEWVMYTFDQQPVAYYFKPSSVRTFGDRVAYTARFPFKPVNTTVSSENALAYEDDRTVIDCKKSLSVLAERTIYNKSGEIMSHFKRGDPESLDFSDAAPIKPGSVLTLAAYVMCDEQIRTPLSREVAGTELSYLTTNGDQDMLYGPTKKLSGSIYQFELLFVGRFHEIHRIADLFPGTTVVGLPPSYLSYAEHVQLNCTDRKALIPKVEYIDQENNSVFLAVPAPPPAQPVDVKEGSPFSTLLNVNCGAPILSVGGIYEGTNDATYKNGGQGDQKITITVRQNGSDVSIAFQTADGGGQGTGTGTLTGTAVNSISLQSTAPGCPGSYQGSLKFEGGTMSWSYKGQDCGGPMEGHGTAKRTKV